MTFKEAYRIYTWSVENNYPWGYYTVDGPVDGPEDLCSMVCFISDFFNIVAIGTKCRPDQAINPRNFVRVASSQEFAKLTTLDFSNHQTINPAMLQAVVERHLRNS